MHTRQLLQCLFLALICSISAPLYASHLAGGQMSYQYLGDSTVAGVSVRKYEAMLVLYQDCHTGDQAAVTQDNPAYFSVFDGAGNYITVDTNIYYSSMTTVLPVVGPCGPVTLPAYCMKRAVFKRIYYLPANTTGYVIAYQRCCRPKNIMNLQSSGDRGLTYFCTIPGTLRNSSAQAVNDKPQFMCLNKTSIFDHSAIDADGDSLTYSLCAAIDGPGDNNIKPIPTPGPYQSAAYISPYTPSSPVPSEPAIRLDAVTGIMSCTPTKVGVFQFAVCVNEWRNGILVNTAMHEFQVEVSDCSENFGGTNGYKPNAGRDTAILRGERVYFSASGGNSYLWIPATYLSDPHVPDPVGTFPEDGTYTYVLHATSDSGCVGRDSVIIRVSAHAEFLLPNAFSPNGDNVNDLLRPMAVMNAQLDRFRVFNRKGQMVHEGGPNDKGWDGTFHGVMQDIGTYYWEVYYYDNKNILRLTKGDATLVR